MRSAIMCYAAEDTSLARELGAFLELNCPLEVFQDEGLIRADYGFLDAVGRGLSADLVLVLLSPDSVPKVWRRDEWVPVLFEQPRELGSEIVFLLARDCKFPELIRRRDFFDLSQDRLAGQRALKRWLLERDRFFQCVIELPQEGLGGSRDRDVLEKLEYRLADRPGVESDLSREVALAFVHTHKADFEGIFWLNCANRSRAGILGDMAHRLDLRLSGNLEQNRCALANFCAGRRCLFLFEHLAPEDREFLTFDGKASVIFVAQGATPNQRSLMETAALFSSRTQDLDACLSALGDAQNHLRGLQLAAHDTWQTRVSLGSAMFALLRHCGRLAEACEVLEVMASARAAKGDSFALYRLEWEKSWLLEQWGQPVNPSARVALLKEPKQLSLEFG